MGAGLGDDLRQLFSGWGRHCQAGRVVIVEDEVGEGGCQLPYRGVHRGKFPSVVTESDGNGAGAHGGDRRDGAVIGRLFDQHPVAGGGVSAQDQADRVLRAASDHDLLRLGGKPSGAVSFGDGFAQRRDAPQVVPSLVKIRRHLPRCFDEGFLNRARRSGQRRDGQID
jgi:hypothetical protein